MITDIGVRPAGKKGLGVFALRPFRKGEFIFRRRLGRVFPNSRLRSLTQEEQGHLCELDFDHSAVLLPPGCYLNHSCDPNAMRSGAKVFAWRNIRRGEELTIDYRLNSFTGERCKCFCGSSSCPGYFINSFFALPAPRQRAYLPYAPPFIRRELRRRQRVTGERSPR